MAVRWRARHYRAGPRRRRALGRGAARRASAGAARCAARSRGPRPRPPGERTPRTRRGSSPRTPFRTPAPHGPRHPGSGPQAPARPGPGRSRPAGFRAIRSGPSDGAPSPSARGVRTPASGPRTRPAPGSPGSPAATREPRRSPTVLRGDLPWSSLVRRCRRSRLTPDLGVAGGVWWYAGLSVARLSSSADRPPSCQGEQLDRHRSPRRPRIACRQSWRSCVPPPLVSPPAPQPRPAVDVAARAHLPGHAPDRGVRLHGAELRAGRCRRIKLVPSLVFRSLAGCSRTASTNAR
ncbi:hypothetical protein HBB16_12280 [Pseudonocardia sp. MCCB 268]|nr:hypothetical protein [Pseudonocardia cytotoxica]